MRSRTEYLFLSSRSIQFNKSFNSSWQTFFVSGLGEGRFDWLSKEIYAEFHTRLLVYSSSAEITHLDLGGDHQERSSGAAGGIYCHPVQKKKFVECKFYASSSTCRERVLNTFYPWRMRGEEYPSNRKWRFWFIMQVVKGLLGSLKPSTNKWRKSGGPISAFHVLLGTLALVFQQAAWFVELFSMMIFMYSSYFELEVLLQFASNICRSLDEIWVGYNLQEFVQGGVGK